MLITYIMHEISKNRQKKIRIPTTTTRQPIGNLKRHHMPHITKAADSRPVKRSGFHTSSDWWYRWRDTACSPCSRIPVHGHNMAIHGHEHKNANLFCLVQYIQIFLFSKIPPIVLKQPQMYTTDCGMTTISIQLPFQPQTILTVLLRYLLSLLELLYSATT